MATDLVWYWYHRPPTPAMRQYAAAQTIFSLILLFFVTLFEHYLAGVQLLLLSAFILVSLFDSGTILDQRKWIFYLEYSRLLIVMTAIVVFYPNNWAFSAVIALLVLLTWYFRPIQRFYFKILYP